MLILAEHRIILTEKTINDIIEKKIKKLYAPMAQLDRALGYGPGGLGFESLWACHLFTLVNY